MKIHFSLLIALLFLSTHSHAQTTTADSNEKAYQAYVSSNQKMLKTYQKAFKGFTDYDRDGAAQKALRVAQVAFLAYRAKEGKLQESIYRGGSMLPTFKFSALKKITDERTRQLEEYQK